MQAIQNASQNIGIKLKSSEKNITKSYTSIINTAFTSKNSLKEQK